MIIFYNEECSKCREALDLLGKNNCAVEVRDYLRVPPSVEELQSILVKLGCDAQAIVRKSEPLYEAKFSGGGYTESEWLNILCENPVLIERPIVISEAKAVIGRPPRLVLDLLKEKL